MLDISRPIIVNQERERERKRKRKRERKTGKGVTLTSLGDEREPLSYQVEGGVARESHTCKTVRRSQGALCEPN